jgi:cholesterol transport system auxiliary component
MLVLPMMLVLAGCGFGRAAPPAQLFDLGPTLSAPPAGASARREPVLVSFTAAQMLTDTGVIWRVGDSASPHSYAGYRWAASPLQLVRQRVVDTLSSDGPVVLDGVDPRAPLLQVSLTRFEQVYAPDGRSSSGQVAMQAVLVRDRTAGSPVVDSVRLVRSAPAPSLDAEGGVLALRAATDAAAGDLSAWLAQRLPAPTRTPAAGLTLRSSP